MTDTAKNEAELSTAAELTWRSQKEWGAIGNTHRSQVTLDNGDAWKFVVDQPRKSYWVARGWRAHEADQRGTGDMVFYREDRTMAGAKAQCQAMADQAVAQTCGECRKISGHELDCSISQAEAREQMRGQRLGMREHVAQAAAMATINSVAETVQRAGRAIGAMSDSMRKLRHLWTRPPGCTCPTPTHRMSCGYGARPVVISKAGA